MSYFLNYRKNLAFTNTDNQSNNTGSYWFITFCDLISLMVAFFVMLYAMSTPKEDGFKFQVEGIKPKTIQDEEVKGKQANVFGLHRTFSKRALSLGYLDAVFSSKIEGSKVFKGVKLTGFDEYLVISIPVDALFDIKGNIVKIKTDKEKLLFEIADMLGNIKNKVKIAGIIPTSFDKESANYELALTFASLVSNILKEMGYKEKVDILTFGNSRVIEKLGLDEVVKDVYKKRIDIIIMADGQNFD